MPRGGEGGQGEEEEGVGDEALGSWSTMSSRRESDEGREEGEEAGVPEAVGEMPTGRRCGG